MTKTLTLLLIATLQVSTVLAENVVVEKESISAGMAKTAWESNTPLTVLNDKKIAPKNMHDSTTKKDKQSFKGKRRDDVIALKKSIASTKIASVAHSNASNALTVNSKQSIYKTFRIYDAYSKLIEDYDFDGFYQTFSVTFDADIYESNGFDHAEVYAELYLSRDGGDWVHYFTTDDFNIYGESDDDEYEVYTTLSNGYIAGDYDVLIDLYEVGYSDIVATISADDTNGLFALPLESSNYDPNYVEPRSKSHGHGGNYSYYLLALLVIVFSVRVHTLQAKK